MGMVWTGAAKNRVSGASKLLPILSAPLSGYEAGTKTGGKARGIKDAPGVLFIISR